MIKVIFTLFNLQGTARSLPLSRSACIYYHVVSRLSRTFFQNFLKFFQSSCQPLGDLMNFTTASSDCQELFSGPLKEFTRLTFGPNSLIFPSIQANLHRFAASIVCRLGDSLHILSHCPPFVNTFFHNISGFTFCTTEAGKTAFP